MNSTCVETITSLDDKTLFDWFDCVAPIAIYHSADLQYEQKAKNAFNRLMTNKRRKLFELYAGKEKTSPTLNHPGFYYRDAYQDLFSEIMARKRPDLKKFHDSYGALAWKNDDGFILFAGDDIFMPPWFLTSEALLERVEVNMYEA